MLKLRVSLTAFGEVLGKMFFHEEQNSVFNGYSKLKSFIVQMGERFEIYSPRLRGLQENIDKAINILKERDDRIRDSDADVLILAHAMVDEEASSIYTMDTYLLNNFRIEKAIKEFRSESGMRSLSIKEPIS